MSWPGCNYGDTDYVPSDGDLASAREMVKTSLDIGINLFDTAEGYGLGLAEEILGGVLRNSDVARRRL